MLDMRKSRQYLNVGDYSVYIYLYRDCVKEGVSHDNKD